MPLLWALMRTPSWTPGGMTFEVSLLAEYSVGVFAAPAGRLTRTPPMLMVRVSIVVLPAVMLSNSTLTVALVVDVRSRFAENELISVSATVGDPNLKVNETGAWEGFGVRRSCVADSPPWRL